MCCGNKRNAFLGPNAPPASKQPDNVQFRYTGNGQLRIRGRSGGQIYHFSTLHRQLTVKKEDVQIIRRFAELVEEE
jgi:hypothetical protein